MTVSLKAPFPWFGGKSRASSLVWEALGDVKNYVEPFAGSLAVLLGRPHDPHVETVNDLDCYVANVWRAIQHDPDQVASWAGAPVNEADLSARHQWLIEQVAFREAMMTDPAFFDPKVAGWWLWGVCAWIGSGWCDLAAAEKRAAKGTSKRQLPYLSFPGQGVHALAVRQLPHLGNPGQGVHKTGLRALPALDGAGGKGIHRPSVSHENLVAWMHALADRLRFVRVACGDWTRVVTPGVLRASPPSGGGESARPTGVFLDPPYGTGNMRYGVGRADVEGAVRDWAIAHGDNPRLRIVLAGYDGQIAMPAGWREVAWKANGGYGSTGQGQGRDNPHRERLFLSPACLPVASERPVP